MNYRSDADLNDLSQQLPSLARMGINCLILEVNYGFEYRSHPELRMGDHPITPDGAHRFAETCRGLGIWPIPQFNCLVHHHLRLALRPAHGLPIGPDVRKP